MTYKSRGGIGDELLATSPPFLQCSVYNDHTSYLRQGVVYKDVLLLRLYEVVALRADVLEKGEDVDVAARLDLAHHRVQHDVAPGATHARAGTGKITNFVLSSSSLLLYP